MNIQKGVINGNADLSGTIDPAKREQTRISSEKQWYRLILNRHQLGTFFLSIVKLVFYKLQ